MVLCYNYENESPQQNTIKKTLTHTTLITLQYSKPRESKTKKSMPSLNYIYIKLKQSQRLRASAEDMHLVHIRLQKSNDHHTYVQYIGLTIFSIDFYRVS